MKSGWKVSGELIRCSSGRGLVRAVRGKECNRETACCLVQGRMNGHACERIVSCDGVVFVLVVDEEGGGEKGSVIGEVGEEWGGGAGIRQPSAALT